jgi:hypothetical protein
MRKTFRLHLAAALLAASLAAQAQAPAVPANPAPAAAPARDAAKDAEELRKLCSTVAMAPADPLEAARRAECILSGALPSPNRLQEARALARSALMAGEPSGGLMLYLVFQNDPANQFVRDGKPDMEAYRKLAARRGMERREQVEAIDGLGFAASKGNVPASLLLLNYFHDTVAPRNVSRTGAMAALLLRNGERHPMVERFAREADAIARSAAGTKASVRAFLTAHQGALQAANAGFKEQAGGKSCDKLQLQSVSSTDVEAPQYLPLTNSFVKDTYLLRGKWSEFWTFQGCEQQVPVKVTFEADGWGGATSTAVHNKGS